MNGAPCVREDELLEALQRGFVGAELDGHATACSACSELRLVAGALLDERAKALAEAAVPSSGTMWWRIEVRQRHDAQAAAQRSLLIGQALTLGIALVLVGAFFGTELAAGARDVIATIRVSTPILIAIATWIVAAPVAGWVALRQK